MKRIKRRREVLYLPELDPELLLDEDDEDEGERRFLSSLRRDGLGERVRLRPKGSTGLQRSMRRRHRIHSRCGHACSILAEPWPPKSRARRAAVALT